jgi:glycopeptide antibiotics resistance protein
VEGKFGLRSAPALHFILARHVLSLSLSLSLFIIVWCVVFLWSKEQFDSRRVECTHLLSVYNLVSFISSLSLSLPCGAARHYIITIIKKVIPFIIITIMRYVVPHNDGILLRNL